MLDLSGTATPCGLLASTINPLVTSQFKIGRKEYTGSQKLTTLAILNPDQMLVFKYQNYMDDQFHRKFDSLQKQYDEISIEHTALHSNEDTQPPLHDCKIYMDKCVLLLAEMEAIVHTMRGVMTMSRGALFYEIPEWAHYDKYIVTPEGEVIGIGERNDVIVSIEEFLKELLPSPKK